MPIVILAAWWIVSADSTDPFWPPLKEIFETFAPTWFEGRMTSDVIPSLLRLAAGYTIALVVRHRTRYLHWLFEGGSRVPRAAFWSS